jgi:hypothetical protein
VLSPAVCRSINEQSISPRIASACSTGKSLASLGEIDGHELEAKMIPIKEILIRNAFKILRTIFMWLLYYI